MRFKIDWANLIVGRKFTVFAFLLCIRGQFQSTSPLGAYIWRGDLTEGFLRYEIGGLIFGGVYTWRGLFSEFYGICRAHQEERCSLLDYLEKEYRISISRMTPNKIFMFLITPPPAEMLKYIKTNSKTRIRMFKKKKRGRWQKIKTLGLN